MTGKAAEIDTKLQGKLISFNSKTNRKIHDFKLREYLGNLIQVFPALVRARNKPSRIS